MSAMFSRRDRVAVAVICLLIAAGWLIRLGIDRAAMNDDGRIAVVKDAVPVPPEVKTAFSPNTGRTDINTADAETLERLPMIGPVRARAIVEWRTKNGPFSSTSAITRVPGIGEGIFAEIDSLITVSGTE